MPFVVEPETDWNFEYEILGLVSLGENLTFLSPFGLLKFHVFMNFIFILKLSFSKPFYNNLNYTSNENIREVMKLYNLGD